MISETGSMVLKQVKTQRTTGDKGIMTVHQSVIARAMRFGAVELGKIAKIKIARHMMHSMNMPLGGYLVKKNCSLAYIVGCGNW